MSETMTRSFGLPMSPTNSSIGLALVKDSRVSAIAGKSSASTFPQIAFRHGGGSSSAKPSFLLM